MGARMSSPCGIARAPPGKKSFCTSTRMRAVLRVGDDMVEKREGQVGVFETRVRLRCSLDARGQMRVKVAQYDSNGNTWIRFQASSRSIKSPGVGVQRANAMWF